MPRLKKDEPDQSQDAVAENVAQLQQAVAQLERRLDALISQLGSAVSLDYQEPA